MIRALTVILMFSFSAASWGQDHEGVFFDDRFKVSIDHTAADPEYHLQAESEEMYEDQDYNPDRIGCRIVTNYIADDELNVSFYVRDEEGTLVRLDNDERAKFSYEVVGGVFVFKIFRDADINGVVVSITDPRKLNSVVTDL